MNEKKRMGPLVWRRRADPKLASFAGCKYHFPLAVFYLPEPPLDFSPLQNFCRIDDAVTGKISANLAFHIRQAYKRREVALELRADVREVPRPFLSRQK